MPKIFFYGPKLHREKAKGIIKSFTDTSSKVTGVQKSAFVVYLRETSHQEVGVVGELLEDVIKARNK